ncbi:hypothetical protein Tco_0201613 [Tanacetum coccineum]
MGGALVLESIDPGSSPIIGICFREVVLLRPGELQEIFFVGWTMAGAKSASNYELVEPLPEPERTLNRRLRRRNRRVAFEQRNNSPQHPRIVYPPFLDINRFSHFLYILRNYEPMDDEFMWAADSVVAPTPGSAITIPDTTNEFAIKGNHLTLVKGN